MNEREMRDLIVLTGKELLKTKLVARTWGNISCRFDENNCLITPSGLDYTQTKPEDIVRLDIITGEWSGIRRPSGEKPYMQRLTNILKMLILLYIHIRTLPRQSDLQVLRDWI